MRNIKSIVSFSMILFVLLGSIAFSAEDRIINIRSYGAIGDGVSHPLSTLFADQAAIDVQYGVGKYFLTDEMDFVAISEAIAKAKQDANSQEGGFAAYGLYPIYMPTGVYKINRMIDLSKIFAMTMYGGGKDATKLVFSGTSQDMFYLSTTSYITFRGFTVESTVASNATAFHFHHPGLTWKFLFDNVGFTGFSKALYASSDPPDMMCCEMVFLNCRFLDCLTGLNLENVQALNFSFFGCDFESSESNAKYFQIRRGGCINVYGGNVKTHGTLIELDCTPTQDGINMISGMYNFNGVTVEQLSPSTTPALFNVTDAKIIRARMNFDNCRLYQQSGTQGQDIGVIRSGVVVAITNSNFSASGTGTNQTAKIKMCVDSDTVLYNQWGSLSIDNSKWLEVYEERTGTAVANTKVHHKVRVSNSATRSDDHTDTGGTVKLNEMDYDIVPCDPMVSVRMKRIYYKEPTGTISSGTITLNIPENGILSRVGVVKTSTETASYVVTNSSASISIGTVNTNSSTKKGQINEIELTNDGSSWDGSIKIQASASGSGYIYCEYF